MLGVAAHLCDRLVAVHRTGDSGTTIIAKVESEVKDKKVRSEARRSGIVPKRHVSLTNLDLDESRGPTLLDRSWTYLCLSRHDCLGIVCYKEYWPGLNRTRRIVLALLILFLGAAINLALYSITDVSCFRVAACSTDCTNFTMSNCSTNVQSLSVRNFGSSSTTVYTNLVQYDPPPAGASEAWQQSFEKCTSPGSPIFNYRHACVRVPRCVTDADARQPCVCAAVRQRVDGARLGDVLVDVRRQHHMHVGAGDVAGAHL